MPAPIPAGIAWRKSSFSEGNSGGGCVEVAALPGGEDPGRLRFGAWLLTEEQRGFALRGETPALSQSLRKQTEPMQSFKLYLGQPAGRRGGRAG